MSRDISSMSADMTLVVSLHLKATTDAAATRILEILASIRDKSLNDEPGTLLYRVFRFERSIMAFEEYENVDAFKRHTKLHPFQSYFKEGSDGLLSEPLSLLYYQDALWPRVA
ncbi:hypothetical protein FRB94_005925 [Tulasnella sp. JGI-2019a]|nr:hypothetical protein FRB93_005192 [Tulasnella sp. JGI-2019a]KAG8999792.1 hypothetical protein FRB94_005925 [Tulasnella sp. JGI-2019a]KAG9028305.1 hypothetical protein FRB95_006609 [Tulasnella sp. JGI-2019a]